MIQISNSLWVKEKYPEEYLNIPQPFTFLYAVGADPSVSKLCNVKKILNCHDIKPLEQINFVIIL